MRRPNPFALLSLIPFPMRSIAIMNQKGGVGKTTTAVNLSAALAETGAKVCLIDLDPQAHATLHFGIESKQVEFASIYEVFGDEKNLLEVRRQVAENFWLVPSHRDLVAAEVELAGKIGREMILRDKLTEDDMKFDYVIMDCPPSLGVLTINALTAVDEVFVPLQPQYFALDGLIELSQTIDLVFKRLNKSLRLSGVIFCLFERTRLATEVIEAVETFLKQRWPNTQVFQTKIRRNIRLAEAPSFGQPIFQYDPSSHGAEDYRLLAVEIHQTAENSDGNLR